VIDAAAREFIGVPWAHQGRNPAVGIDCVGLVVLSLRACGIEVKDRTDYGRHPDGSIRAEITAALGAPAQGVQPGDVALVNFRAERHVGIVSCDRDGLTLIHADSHRGKVVEHPMDARWLARVVATWRVAP